MIMMRVRRFEGGRGSGNFEVLVSEYYVPPPAVLVVSNLEV
jgi:hypothetical protein